MSRKSDAEVDAAVGGLVVIIAALVVGWAVITTLGSFHERLNIVEMRLGIERPVKP